MAFWKAISWDCKERKPDARENDFDSSNLIFIIIYTFLNIYNIKFLQYNPCFMAASWFIKNQFFQKFKIGHKNPLHDAKIHPSAEILTRIDS